MLCIPSHASQNRQDEDPQEVIYDQVNDTGLRQGVGPCSSHQGLGWMHTTGQMEVDKQVGRQVDPSVLGPQHIPNPIHS